MLQLKTSSHLNDLHLCLSRLQSPACSCPQQKFCERNAGVSETERHLAAHFPPSVGVCALGGLWVSWGLAARCPSEHQHPCLWNGDSSFGFPWQTPNGNLPWEKGSSDNLQPCDARTQGDAVKGVGRGWEPSSKLHMLCATSCSNAAPFQQRCCVSRGDKKGKK